MKKLCKAEIIDFEFFQKFGMLLFTHHSLYKQKVFTSCEYELSVIKAGKDCNIEKFA